MLKVMLIEDNQNTVSLLTTLLKLEGYAVAVPGNHRTEGILKSVRSELPHIMFVDVNLRHGSGLELVRKIRQESETMDLRIIMSSGLSMKHECLQAGADSFIQKPFMPDDLLKVIHAAITKKKIKK